MSNLIVNILKTVSNDLKSLTDVKDDPSKGILTIATLGVSSLIKGTIKTIDELEE